MSPRVNHSQYFITVNPEDEIHPDCVEALVDLCLVKGVSQLIAVVEYPDTPKAHLHIIVAWQTDIILSSLQSEFKKVILKHHKYTPHITMKWKNASKPVYFQSRLEYCCKDEGRKQIHVVGYSQLEIDQFHENFITQLKDPIDKILSLLLTAYPTYCLTPDILFERIYNVADDFDNLSYCTQFKLIGRYLRLTHSTQLYKTHYASRFFR